jgi:hypothetical protein
MWESLEKNRVQMSKKAEELGELVTLVAPEHPDYRKYGKNSSTRL